MRSIQLASQELVASLPIIPFFVTVSGAHLYGFPSPDSDIDLRGAHLMPEDDLCRLPGKPETFERKLLHNGIEIEFVSHSLRKFVLLLATGENGYVLEQVMSPLVVHAHPDFEEFKELARRCICRKLFRHFSGFFRKQMKLFEEERPKRAKTLLYCYRVALAGIHVLQTGTIESNLLALNEWFKLPFIDQLVAMKQREESALDEHTSNWHLSELQRYDEQLRRSYESSQLPDEPENIDALDIFVTRVTMKQVSNLDERFRIENRDLPLGTQVVTRTDRKTLTGDSFIKTGNVGVVLARRSPSEDFYVIRVLDGREAEYRRSELAVRSREVENVMSKFIPTSTELADRVIFDCVIGSRAYGLATDQSDEDHRGIYLAPMELLCSLWDAPEQIEPEPEHVYWEIRKFLRLAAQANPNVLECLWTPIVIRTHPVADELRAMRDVFLSKNIFRTFGGYAMSQFKKMEADVRQRGKYRQKHALHLIRLLIAGAVALREGTIPVDMSDYREKLLAILSEELSLQDIAKWRRELEEDFNRAYEQTLLPDSPDLARVNEFLTRVRGGSNG